MKSYTLAKKLLALPNYTVVHANYKEDDAHAGAVRFLRVQKGTSFETTVNVYQTDGCLVKETHKHKTLPRIVLS